jgi:hypothetical protein
MTSVSARKKRGRICLFPTIHIRLFEDEGKLHGLGW